MSNYKYLINSEIDDRSWVCYRADQETDPNNGITPLMKCCNAAETSRVIATGADVNAQSDTNHTALMYSTSSEQTRLLLRAGASATINEQSWDGFTALMLARNGDIVKLLAESGVDIDIKDNRGNKAIHFCYNDIDKMKALIKAGADVNSTGEDGANILHLACKGKYLDMIRFLVEEVGIDPKLTDSRDRNVYYYVIYNSGGKNLKKKIREFLSKYIEYIPQIISFEDRFLSHRKLRPDV